MLFSNRDNQFLVYIFFKCASWHPRTVVRQIRFWRSFGTPRLRHEPVTRRLTAGLVRPNRPVVYTTAECEQPPSGATTERK